MSAASATAAGVLSLLLAVGCAARSQSQHLERLPLQPRACRDLPSCLDVLERSSDVAAQQHAEEQVAAFGAAAIPHLAKLVAQGDAISKYRAPGALGRIAATRPAEVLAGAGDGLLERCADSGWSACWALAQTKDHSVYPVLAQHLRAGIDVYSLFDNRPVPAVAAEWFLVELEDRAASAAVHAGVLDVLHRAERPLSSASLERIRKLLRAELPPDLNNVPAGYPCHTSGSDCWSVVDRVPQADQCPASLSECWPRVDYLVEAVGLWGPGGLLARDEVRAVWQSTPAPHKYVARRALARIGDRAIVPSLLRELSPLDERALRDLGLLGKLARPDLPQLIALLQTAPGNERQRLLETILAIGGPLAVNVAVKALHESGDDDEAALTGLLEASKEGTAVDSIRGEKARLEYLATRSAFAPVRPLARELLVALGFEAPAQREPLPCPPVIGPSERAPQARLVSGPVTFQPLEGPARNDAECANGGMPTIRVGEECLHGHSFGEFGHKIAVHDASSEQPRDTVRGVGLNPVRFLRYGKHLLVIEALAHGMGSGQIDRLIRDSSGRWVAHRFTSLPALPVGYAFDGDRRLLLLAQDTFGGFCHDQNGGWQVLRIGTDGEVEALR